MKASKEHKPQQSRVVHSSKVAQRLQRILGSQAVNQTATIGINLMPSGGLIELLPGNGRGYSALSSKIAGHSSIISLNQQGGMSKGRGFSPYGFLRSALVGITGFLPFMRPIDVWGNYHAESQNIIDDPKAIQLLIRVTPQTQMQWEDLMGNEGSGGIYSYRPLSAMQPSLDGYGSDNCTTIAIRNAVNFCIILLNDTSVQQEDKTNLLILKIVLESMIEQVVEQNQNRRTSVGTQGRMMRAMSDIWNLNDIGE